MKRKSTLRIDANLSHALKGAERDAADELAQLRDRVADLEALRDALLMLRLTELSPLEALTKLHELKRLAQEGADAR